MSREEVTIILYTIFSLDKGAGEVANLGNNGKEEARKGKVKVIGARRTEEGDDDITIQNEAEGASDGASDSAFDALLGADDGSKLMLAEEGAEEVGEDIGRPCGDKHEGDKIAAVLDITDNRK